jgi:hypothetical protein
MNLLTRHFVFMRQVTERAMWWFWLSHGNVSFCVWAENVATITSELIPLDLSGYICATRITHTIKLLHSVHKASLCVSCGSQDKRRIFTTALTYWSL